MVALLPTGWEKKPAHALVVQATENPSGASYRIKTGEVLARV